MFNIPRAVVENLRNRLPKGTIIELVEMVDDPRPVPAGTRGEVEFIDDIAQIHVKWNNGGTLPLIHGIDKYREIKKNS